VQFSVHSGAGADDPPPDEYPVHPSKSAFEALLLAEAARAGYTQGSKRTRLNGLAAHCSRPEALARAGERESLAGTTLVRDIREERLPNWSTLRKLQAGTGVALGDWLYALGVIDDAWMAAKLDRELPPDVYTESERELLAASRDWGPVLTEMLTQIWRRSRPPQSGGALPPDPSPGGGSG
jgi:hypothetical protein